MYTASSTSGLSGFVQRVGGLLVLCGRYGLGRKGLKKFVICQRRWTVNNSIIIDDFCIALFSGVHKLTRQLVLCGRYFGLDGKRP